MSLIFAYLPVEFSHISYENNQQQNHIMETLFDITARHLKNIFRVELFKNTAFQLNELLFKNAFS